MNETQKIAERLVATGAVMQLPGETPLHFLVGAFVWLDDHRVFWFTAHGQSEFDGHVLEFEAATTPHLLGVAFHRKGELVGYLTSINEADLIDVASAKTDWETWTNTGTVAGRQSFIDEVKSKLAVRS